MLPGQEFLFFLFRSSCWKHVPRKGQKIFGVVWCACLLPRKTTTSLQLILLCYRLPITRYPGGFPFKQKPHWFTFQRNCSLDHFTLLPCHTMFWSDLHVHFRSASPPCGCRSARQSSHCPRGQSSIPNIQSFTTLETRCMLSKGRVRCWWMPSTPSPSPNEASRKPHDPVVTNDFEYCTSFAQCRSAGCGSVIDARDWPQIVFIMTTGTKSCKHEDIFMILWLKMKHTHETRTPVSKTAMHKIIKRKRYWSWLYTESALKNYYKDVE